MSQEYIEITEKTVEQAITTACQRLSVTSSRLDYIVVQREKTGFLGIGAKPAVIKARVKEAAPEPVNFDKAMDEAAKAEEAARKANEAIEAQKARKADLPCVPPAEIPFFRQIAKAPPQHETVD